MKTILSNLNEDFFKTNSTFARGSRLYLEENLLFLITPFNKQFVAECREVPGRLWDNSSKTNTFPTSSVTYLTELCERWGIYIPNEIKNLPPSESDNYYPQTINKQDDNLLIKFLFNPDLLTDLKTNIPQARWNGKEKIWSVSTDFSEAVIELAKRWDFYVEPGVFEEIDKIVGEQEAMFAASNAVGYDSELKNAHKDLLPYQRAGVAYMLQAKRAILGDQPGLGKTLQAMSTLVMADKFPAVVVCPNTLKLNWENEVKKFYPNLTTNVVYGKTSQPLPVVDITIINYDILHDRLEDVFNLKPNTLIVDESHAIKNGKANYFCPECNVKVRSNSRNCSVCKTTNIVPTKKWSVRRAGAVLQLSEKISDDGLVLLLTGTPITNRPIELIPQLEAINALERFGGRWKFESRYCPGGTGAAFMGELNKKMRSFCYVRRNKKDVYTELPEVRNAVQILNIPEKLYKEYQTVEKDVIEVLAQRAKEAAAEEGLDPNEAYWEKTVQLQFMEHLVRLTVLRDAVAKMKYDAITDWLDQFLDNGEEKVVVFAEHIDFVERLAQKYGDIAVKIRGGVSNDDRMSAVERFQTDPTCRMFIGNMRAASEGLTLTAASDVVFCELAWTPATHEQCVGRCYGRVNDLHGATAWYLLAQKTIDEDIFELLEEKKLIVDAVTNGIDPAAEHGVMMKLLMKLTKRGLDDNSHSR